ncbi:MAG: CocE/NonD family hydrolase [Angustibacter sp.]
MTRTRTLAATALLALAAAATTAAGPPAASAATGLDAVTTVPDLTFTVATGPDGATPCTIDADLYLPASASATNRVPAILTTNGFGGSKADQAGLGRAFAQRGYAVLSYTGLGFPDSGCKITLDDPAYDGRAASQLISFLGGTGTATKDGAPYTMPDVIVHDATDHAGVAHPDDPRVGMVGGSYGGQIQFATAKVDKRLDAIVPIITWNDLQYSLAPNNTSLTGVTPSVPGTEKIGWTSLFFGVGIADGVQGATIDPSRDVGCPNFRTEACHAKVQLDTFGYPDDATVALTNQVSVGHYLDDVVIPTFLLQGEKDTLFNLQEAVATYRGLRARGVPVKMVWQSWGHSGSTPAPGELDLNGGDIEGTYLGQRIKDWFDHYLKDSTVSTGATFAYFRDWVDYSGNARPAFAETGRYPAVSKPTPLYLSGGDGLGSSGGALVASTGAVRPGTTSWSNPGGGAAASYSETSALQGSAVPDAITPPYDTPGTFGAWTTAPLDADTDLVGMPTLDVRLSSPVVAAVQSTGPASQLLVFAKLYDVAPDGSLTLVNRLISPTRVGDVTRPVHIELPGIVHRVPAGHRLRLVLAATDAAYKNAVPVQPVSVVVDPTSPAVLRLPITR